MYWFEEEKLDASPPPFEFCTSTIKMVKMQVTTISTVNITNILVPLYE
jgi:hypothetical protein